MKPLGLPVKRSAPWPHSELSVTIHLFPLVSTHMHPGPAATLTATTLVQRVTWAPVPHRHPPCLPAGQGSAERPQGPTRLLLSAKAMVLVLTDVCTGCCSRRSLRTKGPWLRERRGGQK